MTARGQFLVAVDRMVISPIGPRPDIVENNIADVVGRIRERDL